MRRPEYLPPNLYVYRRVPGWHWQRVGGRDAPKGEAFLDRQQRLSVYAADFQTPRSILQLCIDVQRGRGRSGERWLARHGRTVEELVHGPSQWRVVRVPLSVLLEHGLTFTHVEGDGHLEVCGDLTGYEDLVAEGAELLSPEECLG